MLAALFQWMGDGVNGVERVGVWMQGAEHLGVASVSDAAWSPGLDMRIAPFG